MRHRHKRKKKLFHQQILKSIKKNHELIYKATGDSYFIFKGEKNSKVHFKIKGLSGMLFGIWIDYRNNTYEIFGEFEELIDKFKPSATYFCVNSVHKFNKIIKQIKPNYREHFIRSLNFEDVDSKFEADYSDEYKKYWNKKVLRNEKTIANAESLFNYVKGLSKSDDIFEIYVTDNNYKSPFRSHPRFEVRVVWTSDDIDLIKYREMYYQFEESLGNCWEVEHNFSILNSGMYYQHEENENLHYLTGCDFLFKNGKVVYFEDYNKYEYLKF